MNSGSESSGTTVEDLRNQVQRRLREELGQLPPTATRDYSQFKKENIPTHHSLYERAAISSGKILSVNAGKNTESLQRDLDRAHLACSPKDVMSLALLAPIAVFLIVFVATVAIPRLFTGGFSPWFSLFSLIVALMSYVPLANMPRLLAQSWRQKASNQMVLCVFYVVSYMRHTPNLELALEFASSHIGPPLSLDIKKVLWDVETQKYSDVQDSLEYYLNDWREDAREFVEAMQLIQGSLYESTQERRLASLDKSLEVMLDETYEKMLHYAQDLKSPMTMLQMLGVVLPVLGLVILPLAVSFLDTHWTIIASLYNVLLPAGVLYLGARILSTRPTGYGTSDLSNSAQKKEQFVVGSAVLVGALLILVGLSPLIIHAISPGFDVYFIEGADRGFNPYRLIGYIDFDGSEHGPFGLGASLLSLFIPLGLGLGMSLYYVRRTKNIMDIRKRTRELEAEFASALFLLGNRIGDGIPIEIAFGKVGGSMDGTQAGKFFSMVSQNISTHGMGVNDAIFDERAGAITEFPSNMINSSMKVLVESARKGPGEASQALMSMSKYIKEMHRVDERLKDLLADVISSMKSQVNFLLPTIAGVVIGITSMITSILGAVKIETDRFANTGLADIQIDFGLGVPTYFFQIVVGIYVVQVGYILSGLISGVENGVDPAGVRAMRAQVLKKTTLIYVGLAFVVMFAFNLIVEGILTALAG